MANFIVFSDVTSDLSKELRERFDIEYVNGHIILPDGTERQTSCEWDFCTQEEFYKDLKKNPTGYSTSPASPDEFFESWEKWVRQGYDILSLAISSGLSGTYNFMLLAKKQIEEKYPDRKVYVVDTLRYSTALGLLAVRASLLKAEGKNIEETVAWLEENKSKLHQMGFLDDLSFVAAKGRISKSKAFMGQLIGVKPLGDFNYEGMTTVLGKVKGDKDAIDTIIKYIQKTIENPQDQIIFIASTNRLKQAIELKKRIEETFKPKEVIMNDVYVGCGVNIGPGLMAAYYFGTKISDELVEEKKIINDIINSK